MMRRNIWSIGLIVSAFSALLWTTAAAQQQCCAFRVRHNFKLCLNGLSICPGSAVGLVHPSLCVEPTRHQHER
jgi:hypothetical protein